MSNVVLGVNNCFALKRWTEPARWLGIVREDLDPEHVQISLDVVDVDASEPHWSVVARTIRRHVDALGIHVHSVFGGLISYSYNGLLHPSIAYRNRRLDWFAKAIHRAADLGAETFGGPLGALTEGDHRDPRRRTYMKEVLVEELVFLAEVGRSAGLRSLLWEPTPWRVNSVRRRRRRGRSVHRQRRCTHPPRALCRRRPPVLARRFWPRA